MGATPLSHWIGFHLYLLAILGLELAFYRYRRARRPDPDQETGAETRSTAVVATARWVGAALLLTLFVLRTLGAHRATEYLAGYSIEEALSVDNLFLFLVLFRLFGIEGVQQRRVVFWGVLGAVLLRRQLIAGGVTLLSHFGWVSYLFAVLLLVAAVRLVLPGAQTTSETPPAWLRWITRVHPVSLRQDRFFVRENGRPMITILLLALLAIEITDVVFALDSIPAVLSVTRHPFLAYTSNIMAVMGLRSLFFLLAGALGTLRYLHFGLAAVLTFAAVKMLLAQRVEIGPVTSLAAIVGILSVTAALSLLRPEVARPA